MGKMNDLMDVWLGIAPAESITVRDCNPNHPMKKAADYLVRPKPRPKTIWSEYEPKPIPAKKVATEHTVSIYEMIRTERIVARESQQFTNELKMDMAKVRKFNREVLI